MPSTQQHLTRFKVIIPPSARKQRNWRLFAIGLGVRLLGVGFLWAGDGHTSLGSKIIVILGVILSIGGLAVLRFMLMGPLLARLTAPKARQPPNSP